MLKCWGSNPTSVGSGDEAIVELLAASGAGQQYALILCDLLMPLVVDSNARRELGEQARVAVARYFSFDRMLSDFRARVLDRS